MITSRLRGSGWPGFAVVTIDGARIGCAPVRLGIAVNDNARPLRFIADRLAPESAESDPHLAAWLAAIREKLQADSDIYRAAFTPSGPHQSNSTLAELARAARGSALGFDRDGERLELVNLLEQIGVLTPSRTISE